MTNGPLAQRRIGEALKALRESAGLEQADAAKVIGADRTAVSRIESGKRRVRSLELSALLDLYQATPGQRESLEALNERRGERGWWVRYRQWITPAYAELIGLASVASKMQDWQPAIIPWHLQTEAYTRAVMAATGTPNQEQLLEVRRHRLRWLEVARPEIQVVVDESVLNRVVGCEADHRAQLERLLEAGRQENIKLRLLPYAHGAHAVGVGGFTILSYPDGDQYVWGDTVAGDSCLEEEKPDLCIAAFDRLWNTATDPELTLEVIRQALERSA